MLEGRPRARPPLVSIVMVAACLVYAAVALASGHRLVSGLVAPVVAVLLWRRHPRARFAAYVLLSMVGLRGIVTGQWLPFLFALAAILVMQTPAAQRVWPRVTPGGRRPPAPGISDNGGGDRMARP